MSDTPLAKYCFRRSVLESGACYSVYDDRLVVEGAMARTILLSEILTVHLKYEHTKQREYYICRIHTARGRVDLRHVSWAGFNNFEDRRRTYTPFVKTLLAQLAGRPGVHFKAGSMANFIGAIIGLPVMLTLGVLALWRGRYGYAALAGFFVTLCIYMIGPSRPRPFDPREPPEDLLPD
ncbi:MAG TPA: hypothetical protein VEK11_01900 [Thermoanaerobaculia bacterium]|jgi:hypothetical protein|nr:hypothetical protein [Thermoanaerobaculia bacterium]